MSTGIVAAVTSHALQHGRSPAFGTTVSPLKDHMEMLAASVEPAGKAGHATVNAATRSRITVEFNPTARERSYDPDEQPRMDAAVPPVEVPLKNLGTTDSTPTLLDAPST